VIIQSEQKKEIKPYIIHFQKLWRLNLLKRKYRILLTQANESHRVNIFVRANAWLWDFWKCSLQSSVRNQGQYLTFSACWHNPWAMAKLIRKTISTARKLLSCGALLTFVEHLFPSSWKNHGDRFGLKPQILDLQLKIKKLSLLTNIKFNILKSYFPTNQKIC